ncbi:hypothetical protein EVA_17886 [gut metagenome]|uniref:Uncharacterized protein n=1 Tax=gut metagenome TaxID=749906 RepID=J9FWR4_9ZZZZ
MVRLACKKAGISPPTFYKYKREDAEFAAAADVRSRDTMVDIAESALMNRVLEGDTTATIFLLKTRGKYRGWSEKNIPTPEEVRKQEEEAAAMDKRVKQMIEQKKRYIIKLLKKEGKYTAELSYQVELTATLLMRYDMIKKEIFSTTHKCVNVEISREGNTRETISPVEALFLKIHADLQRSLRALGMNTESKERRTDGDDFGEFMKQMQENDDE